MKTIPTYLSKFFWDTKIDQIDVVKNRQYIISRLLHTGDESALRWLTQTYSKGEIKQCLNTSRELTLKDKNFYKLIY